jgi:ferric-dicitrate binding protein FerR (iron transport regulator)
MNEIKLHSKQTDEPSQDSFPLFSVMEIPWEKSKNQVWEELSAKIDSMPKTRQRTVFPLFYSLSAAAVIVVLVAITLFLRLHTTTISSIAGGAITAQLPDGSTVGLNAGSSLSYHPYWWQFAREVDFEGEGFFEVQKGNKFEVSSKMAKTIVLGTSFNIVSRVGKYQVLCVTGRVKVVSNNDGEVVLNPDEQAFVGLDGAIKKQHGSQNENTGKNHNEYLFTGTPLRQVVEEISRHYGVMVNIKIDKELFYTGNFTNEKPLNDVLELVCKPFGLSFTKQADGSYLIFQNK